MIHLIFSFPYAQLSFLFLSLIFSSVAYWKEHGEYHWKMLRPWSLLDRRENNNIWTILAFLSFLFAIMLTILYVFYYYSFSKI